MRAWRNRRIMRQTLAAGAAIAMVLCGCSKAQEPPEHPSEQPSDRTTVERDAGQHPSAPAEAERESGEAPSSDGQPRTVERQAGTYDSRHDEAPGAGPGAARVGDVPGTGLEPITHPVPTPPQADPSAAPLDPTPTTPAKP